MKYILIFETYKSQKELETLTNDILIEISKLTYKYTKDIKHFYNLSYPTTLKFIDINKYNELKSFLQSNIRLKMIKKENFTNGYYDINNNYISISYKEQLIKDIIQKREVKGIYSYDMIYFSIYDKLHNILLHELQHAYDSFRLGDKFMSDKNTIQYFNNFETIQYYFNLKNKNINLSPDELKEFEKYRNMYVNMQSEVDARFTQTMKTIQLTTVDSNTYKIIIRPFSDVKADFIKYFEYWKYMNVKWKKRMLHRLGKYYEKQREELI